MTQLFLYNTLTRRKEEFTPLDPKNVRMYVCGPTVYDRPHLGNARSTVVYDVLYRVLREIYGKDHVTYARNITDVDDKINAAAKQNGEPISALTARVEGWFHDDIRALNCLPPTHEPRATAHIAEMIAINQQLISEGHAYVADGHVLFAVDSYKDYGALSGRKLEELIAGARIEVESYKKHPGDFVLWKPSDEGDDPSSVFDSPWGSGRPGWHIECSAMSSKYLGEDFDIHGGGADLMFPHHENEIAQSRCSAKGSHFARYWVHNGFLTVGGEKMSKSLGNFTTVKDVLDKGVHGEVIRLAYLMTKYNEPLDWNEKLLGDAKKRLDYFYRALKAVPANPDKHLGSKAFEASKSNFIGALCNDLNLPEAQFLLGLWAGEVLELNKANDQHLDKALPRELASTLLKHCGNMLGLLQQEPESWFKGSGNDDSAIQAKIDARIAAKKAKNFAEADRIRKELADAGILLEDRPNGTTDWRRA
ncbi:MAG: cysteine--tRNA ligase [Rickettsiales bacterium]|jgi:cysteinyl-tRNA synthetase|nr:cysteine--tRNA ligase [Rickettsiales bacterium]